MKCLFFSSFIMKMKCTCILADDITTFYVVHEIPFSILHIVSFCTEKYGFKVHLFTLVAHCFSYLPEQYFYILILLIGSHCPPVVTVLAPPLNAYAFFADMLWGLILSFCQFILKVTCMLIRYKQWTQMLPKML